VANSSKHNLQLLVDGLDFGEGPRWHDGRLWYSDFHQHCVYAVAPDGTREAMVNVGVEQPSGLGWLPDGDLLVVAMTARQVWRIRDGVQSIHADLSHVASWHCNDMVVATNGTAYVGNFGFDLEGGVEPTTTSLAIVRSDGSVEVGPDGLAFPNGSVITPDGKTLVVCETFASRLTAFDVSEEGSLSNRRIWVETPNVMPDGCCLDEAGGIWVANAMGHEVVRYEENGVPSDRIAMPLLGGTQTAFACMLGGDDGRTLHCLTAPGADIAATAGRGAGAIWTVRVEHPGAGLP